MPSRAVSDDTMKRAKSFADILGLLREGTGMSDLLDSYELDVRRSVHIGPLSRETIEANDAGHMGEDGFFLFHEDPSGAGVVILGKFPSDEAALLLIDLWQA